MITSGKCELVISEREVYGSLRVWEKAARDSVLAQVLAGEPWGANLWSRSYSRIFNDLPLKNQDKIRPSSSPHRLVA